MSISESSSTLSNVASSLLPSDWTLADLQHRLGDIPAHRILVHLPPGYATEADRQLVERALLPFYTPQLFATPASLSRW